jgi:hypothetical protein
MMARVTRWRWVVRLALLALAFAGATIAVGWSGVPATALVWGLLSAFSASGRNGAGLDRGAWSAGLAAALAWGGLLGAAAWRAPVASLLHILVDVMRVPAPGLLAVTLLLPTALAWSAATVGAAVAPPVTRMFVGR